MAQMIYCGLNSMDSDKEGDDMYDNMMTHKQIQQMFSEESELILLVLVQLIHRFDSRGAYWS